jgi:exosortase
MTYKDRLSKNNNYSKLSIFIGLLLISAIIIHYPIKTLLFSKINSEYYSHIILIPFLSIYLIYLKRGEIFSQCSQAIMPGLLLLAIGSMIYFLGYQYSLHLSENDFAAIILTAFIIFIWGDFILTFGIESSKKAFFPLSLLIFMIPIPSILMDKIIYVLQVGSTELTEVLLMMTGTSYLRDGFVFQLPGMSMEVAKQCSGIRSSIAVIITTIVAGHMFLNTFWKKILLVLIAIPLTILKNSIRITVLALLAIYVDQRIITNGALHRDGGIVFFMLALLIIFPVLVLLRKTEVKKNKIKSLT